MTHRFRNITLAFVLAILAALLTTFYVTNYKKHVRHAQVTVSVLVAAQDIPAGMSGSEVVQKHLLGNEQVARTAVVPGAISSPQQIEQLVATQPVYAGEQVTERRFGPVAAVGVRSQLTGTLRAVQLAGDQNQLLAGTLKAADHVDVVANIKIDPQTDIYVSRVVLRDLKVLKVSPSETGPSKITAGPGSESWVMLAVTDSQEQKLLWVTSKHVWSLELRPTLHAADSPDTVSTILSVLTAGLNPSQTSQFSGLGAKK